MDWHPDPCTQQATGHCPGGYGNSYGHSFAQPHADMGPTQCHTTLDHARAYAHQEPYADAHGHACTAPHAPGDSNAYVGQPQANLWLGKTDDLWQWGKPQGWGGPWFRTPVEADVPSDPFLMTGFEHKCVHFSHDHDGPVRFAIEVDFHGDGEWHFLANEVAQAGSYTHHCFEPGFSAHWVRFRASESCTASAQLHYT